MKKVILSIVMALVATTNVAAQSKSKSAAKPSTADVELYNEVKRLQKESETIANDTTKSLTVRKIATFRNDAIWYMQMKGGADKNFTTRDLAEQTVAMIDFVNTYIRELAGRNRNEQELVVSRYRRASLENSLFNDTDKELTNAYVGNDNYLTQFSLDTNWKKALAEVSK